MKIEHHPDDIWPWKIRCQTYTKLDVYKAWMVKNKVEGRATMGWVAFLTEEDAILFLMAH